MFDCENIMLVGLISIIVIIIVLMYQKNNMVNNSIKNNMANNSIKNKQLVENFVDNMDKRGFSAGNLGENSYKEKYDELQKYMKIQGMYPMGQEQDMSKFVLKSEVSKEDRCADMSQYILKASIPPVTKCPTINRDEWTRKSELPPNWNKACPAHPDLTNYVLKSTIPPNQDCPSCICPKIKVDAGLCREPSKDDCMKNNLCKDACPPPDPLTPEKCAGIIKCPEPKPCPPPPEKICPRCPPILEPSPCPRPPLPPPCPKPTCPICPKPKEVGKCPSTERCPPSQDCPKCYGVKYVKVPVVKSEPLPKPEQQTIFPQNTIETKLLRQHTPPMPRQPKIVKLEQPQVPDAAEENMSPVASINDETTLLQSLLSRMNELTDKQTQQTQQAQRNIMAQVPSIIETNKYELVAPSVSHMQHSVPIYSPTPSRQNNQNNRNEQNNRNDRNDQNNRNSENTVESPERCGPLKFNNSFNSFGIKGFNNKS